MAKRRAPVGAIVAELGHQRTPLAVHDVIYEARRSGELIPYRLSGFQRHLLARLPSTTPELAAALGKPAAEVGSVLLILRRATARRPALAVATGKYRHPHGRRAEVWDAVPGWREWVRS